MNKYKHLFKPIKIGKKEIKNRIFMPPISTNLADKGYVTDELIKHYSARAKGGVGLIVSEVVTVEPVYVYLPGDMSIHDDSYIEGWKKVFAEVHKYGTVLLPQLFHPAYMAFPIPGTPQLIAPSNVGPYYAKSAPRAVTKEELDVIIKQFGDAAYRMKIAGGAGVEIHAAHAHGLLGGFLSPLYNKRCDEYGGDINGRLLLTLRVINEVRSRCGDDFIIDVRISGDEYTDGGLNLNDATYIAKKLEEAGADMLHVSGGTTIKRGSSIPAPGTKQGSHAEVAKAIKKHVHIPVATVGRITEPWIADEMIANEFADACMIGRANLCDPEFANKSFEGREDDIRPCIGCLKCLNGIMFGKRIQCSVNPSFELENEDTISTATEIKKFLVIGGGPSGMEAAFILRRRGHHVVLVEKESELGGLLRTAAIPPCKQELTKVVKYLKRRLEISGVLVKLNEEITLEKIKQEYVDYEVVVSTGSTPVKLIQFDEFKQTMTAEDVLMGRKFPGRKIVILGGGSVGCETADFLSPVVHDRAPRNREIVIIEMAKEVMSTEAGAGRSALVQKLMTKPIEMITNAKVTKVDKDNIYYEQNGVESCISDADTLVYAVGYRSNNQLVSKLIEAGIKVHTCGDASKVQSLKEAISSGFELAKKL